jgi:glycopeptide antibiotics resistance protein
VSSHVWSLVTRTLAAAWLALVAFLTLRPLGWLQHIGFWAFLPSIESGVDVVQNLVLFAPMGWIARRGGWSARRTLVVAFVISAGIEFAQHWVPGRTSQAQDILTNSLGALIGWWVATPARRPNVRIAAVFLALAAFVSLHVLNTSWPEMAEYAGGDGAWAGASRHACALPVGDRTVCVVVPNTVESGNKHVTVIGPKSHTYAHVQGEAFGRQMARGDCLLMKFENTRGYWLRLRPPRVHACALADTSDRMIELRIDPRLEHEGRGPWTPTRASIWMWPVWPFETYQPAQLTAVGALTFVILASLFAGRATWMISAGYLVVLELVALMAGMRAPGWLDGTSALVAWIAAIAAVALDQRWLHERV